MKLHWSPRSPFVRKVMIATHEMGLVDRMELIRSVAAMRKPNPAIMRDNPLSKIPTLVLDDGQALFDSVVICEYLDSLHAGTPLFPGSGRERWDALRWHALGDGLLDALILWRNEREREPERRLQDLMDAFGAKTQAVLDTLEQDAHALDAARFGIGHIAIVCALGYLDFRFSDLDWRRSRPRLTAWFKKQSQRSSVRETAPVDDQ
jgi:glutathione S-transferase